MNGKAQDIDQKICDILGTYGIYAESVKETFEIDSLQYLTLVIDIEDEFSIEIDEKYFVEEKLDSIDSIKKLICIASEVSVIG